MELLYIPGLERYIGPVGMDQRKNVPVARDLLLGAILWRRLLSDKRFDARPRSVDVLDRVGCLRALDHRDSAQGLQASRMPPWQDLRHPPSLSDTRQRSDGFRG